MVKLTMLLLCRGILACVFEHELLYLGGLISLLIAPHLCIAEVKPHFNASVWCPQQTDQAVRVQESCSHLPSVALLPQHTDCRWPTTDRLLYACVCLVTYACKYDNDAESTQGTMPEST